MRLELIIPILTVLQIGILVFWMKYWIDLVSKYRDFISWVGLLFLANVIVCELVILIQSIAGLFEFERYRPYLTAIGIFERIISFVLLLGIQYISVKGAKEARNGTQTETQSLSEVEGEDSN